MICDSMSFGFCATTPTQNRNQLLLRMQNHEDTQRWRPPPWLECGSRLFSSHMLRGGAERRACSCGVMFDGRRQSAKCSFVSLSNSNSTSAPMLTAVPMNNHHCLASSEPIALGSSARLGRPCVCSSRSPFGLALFFHQSRLLLAASHRPPV